MEYSGLFSYRSRFKQAFGYVPDIFPDMCQILKSLKNANAYRIKYVNGKVETEILNEDNIYEISSLFIGFILFAIPIIVREEKDCLKGKYLNMIFIVFGGALVAGITYFSGSTILADGVDLSAGKFGFGVGILLFIAGMVAISAMVLPGISGSTILMVFGLYIPVTTAIKDILHLKFEYIPAVAIFGIGIVIGILLVVKLIKKLLNSFRSQTVYFIIGMMIGSFYSIAMGPTTLKSSEGVSKGLKMLTLDSFSIWFFLTGGVIILGLQYLKYIMEKKSQVQK